MLREFLGDSFASQSRFDAYADHIRPVGVAVLYRYLLDRAVHTTGKLCSVACSCLGKAEQKADSGCTLGLLQIESPRKAHTH